LKNSRVRNTQAGRFQKGKEKTCETLVKQGKAIHSKKKKKKKENTERRKEKEK